MLASTALVGLTFGFNIPLLALIMESRGIDSTWIGLSTACESAAALLIGPFVPKLLVRFDLRPVMLSCAAAGVAMIGGLPFTDPMLGWFPLRFGLGAAMFVLLASTEVWIVRASGPDRRGRVSALYGTTLTSGFAGGPLFVSATGTQGAAPFAVAGGLLAAAGVALLLARRPAPLADQGGQGGLLALLAAGPLLLVGVLGYGVIESSVTSLLPIYGLRSGLPEGEAVVLLSVLIAGCILFQLPIGWVSDHVNKWRVLVACGVCGLAGTAVFSFVLHEPWILWPTLLVLGASAAGIYAVSLALLGDLFAGRQLTAAIAGVDMVLGIGATGGPILAGAAMHVWDPHGLTVVIFAAFGAFVAGAGLRALRVRGAC